MRAKFIYEKFTEDSDPIKDMNIGIYVIHNFNSAEEVAKFLIEILSDITGESDLKKFLDRSYGGAFINARLWNDKIWSYIIDYIRIHNNDAYHWYGEGNIASLLREEIKKRVK